MLPVRCPSREDGLELMRGHDFSAIVLLIRFWPYPDEDLLDSSLHQRGNAIISTLLVLKGAGSREAVAQLNREEKLAQLRPPPSTSAYEQPRWMPTRTRDESAERISAFMAEQSSRLFRTSISFQHLLRHIFGYSITSLDDFFEYHRSVLPTQIYMHLRMFPGQVQKYCRVAQACWPFPFVFNIVSDLCQDLYHRNPFACLAVHQGLRRYAQGRRLAQQKLCPGCLADEPPTHLEPDNILEVIAGPIRRLLHDQQLTLKERLYQLAILAARFECEYTVETEIDWWRDFHTDAQLSGMLTIMLPQALAISITDYDKANFLGLSPRCIMDNNERCRRISRRWDWISQAVQECVIVDRQFSKRAIQLAEVSEPDLSLSAPKRVF